MAPLEVETRGINRVVAANRNCGAELERQLQDMGGHAAILAVEEILEAGR